jgi:hypothetical protein
MASFRGGQVGCLGTGHAASPHQYMSRALGLADETPVQVRLLVTGAGGTRPTCSGDRKQMWLIDVPYHQGDLCSAHYSMPVVQGAHADVICKTATHRFAERHRLSWRVARTQQRLHSRCTYSKQQSQVPQSCEAPVADHGNL